VFSVTPRPLFTPGKEPVHNVQEAGWAPGPIWTGAANLALTVIRSPDPPARSQSLYRLRYLVRLYSGGTRFEFRTGQGYPDIFIDVNLLRQISVF